MEEIAGDGGDIVEVSSDEEGAQDKPMSCPGTDADGCGGPPSHFRGYRLGRELGSGGSGKVFECKGDFETKYAVKAVSLRRIQLSANADRQQTLLRREVEILKALPPHPHIVQMFDAFEEGRWFLLILELVLGGDLFSVLTARRPARFSEPEAVHVLWQVVEGLSFLHGQGVIHRDLKLENILVSSQQRRSADILYGVKITDFGLSKAVGAGFSAALSRVGTRPYTAPEVERGGAYDFSSDLWCLGVFLYVLLAGQFPFSRIPEEQGALDRICGALGISTGLRFVLSSLLVLDPQARLPLDELGCIEWLRPDTEQGYCEAPAERPAKRGRTRSTSCQRAQPGYGRSVTEAAPSDPLEGLQLAAEAAAAAGEVAAAGGASEASPAARAGCSRSVTEAAPSGSLEGLQLAAEAAAAAGEAAAAAGAWEADSVATCSAAAAAGAAAAAAVSGSSDAMAPGGPLRLRGGGSWDLGEGCGGGLCPNPAPAAAERPGVLRHGVSYEGVVHQYIRMHEDARYQALVCLLETLDFDQVTVCVNSTTKAVELGRLLSEDGFPAVAVHADMPRAAVAAHQQRFKDLEKRVLVSTDLADGCTDAPRCDLVINYDAAEDKYGYCFRLPQTAHFQTSGRVVTFVMVDRDHDMIMCVQEELGVKVNTLSISELKPFI